MLTPAQTLLHWKRWRACADANDWVETAGRLSADAQRTAGESIHHRLVWRDAEQLAAAEHRAVTAGDLRHACYRVATTAAPGRSSKRPIADSIKDLNNADFSRVLVLWRILIDPEDLAATIDWDHPERGQAEGMVKSIERLAPDATIRAIAGNAFGTRLWEDLEVNKLRWLLRTLREKQAGWGKRKEAHNVPF